jgi:hypothetical protein
MGTLHENVHACLLAEVTGWEIPNWGIPRGQFPVGKLQTVLANTPELLRYAYISCLVYFVLTYLVYLFCSS